MTGLKKGVLIAFTRINTGYRVVLAESGKIVESKRVKGALKARCTEIFLIMKICDY